MKKTCPSCKNTFITIFESKEDAENHPAFTPEGKSIDQNRIGREQFISGLCEQCQKDLFSTPEDIQAKD